MHPSKSLDDLRYAIAGHLNRQPSTFVVNSRDSLMNAINNAKDFVQRAIDFEYAHVSVVVRDVRLGRGGNLDNARLFEKGFSDFTGILEYEGENWNPDGVGGVPTGDEYVPWGGDRDEHKNGDHSYDPISAPWYAPRTSWQSDAARRPGPPKVNLKRVLRGFLPLSNNHDVAPFTIISKQEWASRRQRLSLDFTSLHINEARKFLAATGFAIVMDGKNFFVEPATPLLFNGRSLLNVYFDGIRWLDNFDEARFDQGHSQFLLDYCFDILLYRSIAELNMFLKEDERVSISKAAWDGAWQNVIQWNATITGNTVDVSLD